MQAHVPLRGNPWQLIRRSKRLLRRCERFVRGVGKFMMMSCAPMLEPLSTLRNVCRSQNIGGAPRSIRLAASVSTADDLTGAGRARPGAHSLSRGKHPGVGEEFG